MTDPVKTYPVVTIITMTLNAEAFIRYALESISHQDYPCIENMIIDGGSSDKTLEIVRNHAAATPHIHTHILSMPGVRTSDAMNRGFEQSSGRYVWALNADDCLAGPGTLSTLVRHLERHPSCDFVFGDMVMIDGRGRCIGYRRFHAGYSTTDLLIDRRHLPFAGSLLRKSALNRLGGGFDPSLTYSNDLEFFLRLSLRGRMDYIPCETGVFRLHPHSSSFSNIQKTGNESYSICLACLELPESLAKLKIDRRRVMASIHAHAAGVAFHSGKPFQVRSHIRKAAGSDPSVLSGIKLWIYFFASIFGPGIMGALSAVTRKLIHKRVWYRINNSMCTYPGRQSRSPKALKRKQ
ncbi:MAG: glycosyltransferase [Pseudomonadota bacterium]